MTAELAASGRAAGAPITVSALYLSPEAVEKTLEQLVATGVPRDLIDVVVSPWAAQYFYAGRATRPGGGVARYAGISGLTGLIVGGVISLAWLALPGFQDPGALAVVQLLGPNMGTTLGAGIGVFAQRQPERRHARAGEAVHRIVVVVAAQSEAEAVMETLIDMGGQRSRIEW